MLVTGSSLFSKIPFYLCICLNLIISTRAERERERGKDIEQRKQIQIENYFLCKLERRFEDYYYYYYELNERVYESY